MFFKLHFCFNDSPSANLPNHRFETPNGFKLHFCFNDSPSANLPNHRFETPNGTAIVWTLDTTSKMSPNQQHHDLTILTMTPKIKEPSAKIMPQQSCLSNRASAIVPQQVPHFICLTKYASAICKSRF